MARYSGVVIENGHPTPAAMFNGIIRVTPLERNWEQNREFIYTGADPPPIASRRGVLVTDARQTRVGFARTKCK